MIIGLTGLAQSGKDTTADVLVENYNFKRVSFAEPLKQIAYDIDPLVSSDKHLAELVDEYGWDFVKTSFPEARRFLQRIGTEGLRKNVDDNFWVNLALTKIENEKTRGQKDFVISDMRFLNEYTQVRKAYPQEFTVWRLHRTGLTSMNHASELEWKSIPATVELFNDLTIEDLTKNIHKLMASIPKD